MAGARKDMLQGWKDIAAYVARDVRTVKRWEKQRGLPVRRMPGSQRAVVYALMSELDQWLAGTGPQETEAEAAKQLIESEEETSDTAVGSAAQGSTDYFLAGRNGSTRGHGAGTPGLSDSFSIAGTAAAELEPRPEAERAEEATNAQGHFQDSPPADLQAVPKVGGTARRDRRRWLAILAGTIALGALTAVTVNGFRMARASRVRTVAPTLAASASEKVAPYGSKVAGVDDLYMRGLYLYEARTPDGLNRALQCFLTASAADPSYAPAYAALASTYTLLREYSMMSSGEAFPKAQAAAERSIALDPRLPDAHASLGFIQFFWNWRIAEADSEFHTAIALDPNSARAHHWYGSMLMHQNRSQEALRELDLAYRLEPTSTAIIGTRAFAMALNGQRNEAIAMLQEVVAQDAASPTAHAMLARISLLEPRDIARFLDETRRFAEVRRDNRMIKLNSIAEAVYRRSGEQAMWSAILEQEQQMPSKLGDRALDIIGAEAVLGRRDEAFLALNELLKKHDPAITGIVIDPLLAPLRLDPRFAPFAKRTGLWP